MTELLKAMQTRTAETTEMSISEFNALKDLIAQCCPGYFLTDKKIKSAIMEIGKESDKAVNPVTGYCYGYEMGVELIHISKKNNWCSQFAGKKQWESIGRKLIAGSKPVYEYKLYGRDVEMFAYEQTIAA